jgi:hypothetical protein
MMRIRRDPGVAQKAVALHAAAFVVVVFVLR